MKITTIILTLTITALVIFTLFSCLTNKKKESVKAENTVTITGRVVVYGNEPHTFAGIESEDGIQYAIYPPEQEAEIRSLQGQLIEFTVILLDEPKAYGSLFLKGGTVRPLEWKLK